MKSIHDYRESVLDRPSGNDTQWGLGVGNNLQLRLGEQSIEISLTTQQIEQIKQLISSFRR